MEGRAWRRSDSRSAGSRRRRPYRSRPRATWQRRRGAEPEDERQDKELGGGEIVDHPVPGWGEEADAHRFISLAAGEALASGGGRAGCTTLWGDRPGSIQSAFPSWYSRTLV